MTTLTILSDLGDGLQELQCSVCDAIFSVVWRTDGFTTGVNYCPFCGEEVGDIVKGEA